MNEVTRWADMNRERRRQAFVQSQQQRRPMLARLAYETGLHPVAFTELSDDLFELQPHATQAARGPRT